MNGLCTSDPGILAISELNFAPRPAFTLFAPNWLAGTCAIMPSSWATNPLMSASADRNAERAAASVPWHPYAAHDLNDRADSLHVWLSVGRPFGSTQGIGSQRCPTDTSVFPVFASAVL